MAKLRSINTHFWDDSYIVELDPIEKLLFLYILTNPLTTIAGAYEVSLRRMAFDTGIDRDMIVKILGRFETAGKIIYRDGWILAVNFIKNQSLNTNMHKAVEDVLTHCPDWIKETVRKGSKGFETLGESFENKKMKGKRKNEDEAEDESAAANPSPSAFAVNSGSSPALRIYRSVYPDYQLTPFQIDLLSTAEVDEAEFTATVEFWAAKGYKERNLHGLMECYQRRMTEKKNAAPEKIKYKAGEVIYLTPDPYAPFRDLQKKWYDAKTQEEKDAIQAEITALDRELIRQKFEKAKANA